MRRILDVRIIRWQLKLVYVVAAIVIIFAITALLHALGVAEIAVLLLGTVLDFAALFFGARVFRGRGEAIEPRRAWWRMTARPTLSRRLGILFVVLALVALVGLVLAAFDLPQPGPTVPGGPRGLAEILAILENSGFAVLYLNSAVRLKRLGVLPKEPKSVPPKEPKFRPPIRLKP
jgi:membrane protease YdiL (CAAX protease family)